MKMVMNCKTNIIIVLRFFLRRGGQAYDVYNYEPQDIINDIFNQFERYLHFVHISPGILPWNMEEHDDDALPEKSDT